MIIFHHDAQKDYPVAFSYVCPAQKEIFREKQSVLKIWSTELYFFLTLLVLKQITRFASETYSQPCLIFRSSFYCGNHYFCKKIFLRCFLEFWMSLSIYLPKIFCIPSNMKKCPTEKLCFWILFTQCNLFAGSSVFVRNIVVRSQRRI